MNKKMEENDLQFSNDVLVVAEKSKIKKVAKVLLVIFGALIGLIILFLIIFVIYINLNKGDIEKSDDSALRPSSEILSKEDNAFYDFKQASDALVISEDNTKALAGLTDGTNWDEMLANKIVIDNAPALAIFDQGAQKKGFQDLAAQVDLKTLNANTVLLANIVSIRRLAQVSSIESMLLFKQGKEKEAFDNTLNIIYAGQVIENSPRVNLIGFLVATAIKEMGYMNIQRMVLDSSLSSSDLKNYITKIEKVKDDKFGLKEAFKMEYTVMNNTKEQMIDKYIGTADFSEATNNFTSILGGDNSMKGVIAQSGFYYKQNETQKLFADQFMKFVNDAGKECNEIVPTQRIIDMDKLKYFVYFKENIIGKILRDVVGVSLESIFDKKCQEDFSLYKTRFMLATRAYKIDKGSYPASMNDLSPAYLDKVLSDFNGKAINYDSKSGVINH